MTAQAQEPAPYDFTTDPDGLTKEDITGRDMVFDILLSSFVGEADSSDELQLTVVLDGVLVSGIAISANEWRKRLKEQLSSAPKIAEAYDGFVGEVIEKAAKANRKREEEDRPTPAMKFIHMRDARIGEGIGAAKAPLWRGNLRQLSGWTLGSSNTPEETAAGH